MWPRVPEGFKLGEGGREGGGRGGGSAPAVRVRSSSRDDAEGAVRHRAAPLLPANWKEKKERGIESGGPALQMEIKSLNAHEENPTGHTGVSTPCPRESIRLPGSNRDYSRLIDR